MNLQNLNLFELNAQELESTDGGLLPYTGGLWSFGYEAIYFTKGYINGFLDNLK